MRDRPAPKKLVPLEAYGQRDVMSLKAVSDWTREEGQEQLNHNRILQPGFLTRPAEEVIADAKCLNVEWLTDIACPSVEASLMLNIAKEVVITYRVEDEQLDNSSHRIFQALIQQDQDAINKLQAKIDREMAESPISDTDELNSLAVQEINKNNENPKNKAIELTQENIDVAKRIIEDRERRKITNQTTNEFLSEQLPQLELQLGLERKPTIPIEHNKDYCFLGAAGSGKSTISRQHLSNEQKKDSIVIATDNYRVFTMPGTEAHEAKKTKNVFTRTQDFAYLVKGLVLEKLNSPALQKSRPNIIFDGVTLDKQIQRSFNQGGEVVSMVAAYAGQGFAGIAERAAARAKDPNAAPADKGRYINTDALLEGHANASAKLLSSIPKGIKTVVYSTDVEKGAAPIQIAAIDEGAKTMEIEDLRLLSEFLNKRNINQKAKHPVELILGGSKMYNMLVTDPDNKAKSVLDLVTNTPHKKAYTLALKDKKTSKVYMTLQANEDGKITYTVRDNDIFQNKMTPRSIEGQVLGAMVKQMELGNQNSNTISNF